MVTEFNQVLSRHEKALLVTPVVLSSVYLIHEIESGRWSHQVFGGVLALSSLLLAGYSYWRKKKSYHENLRTQIASVAFDSDEAIIITDADTRILEVNAAFSRISGYDREDVLGKKARALKSCRHDISFFSEMSNQINRTGGWAGEVIAQRKSGEAYVKWLLITAIKSKTGQTINYVGKFYDLTHRRKIEADVTRLSYTDTLTGLPNRKRLQDAAIKALCDAKDTRGYGALLFIDMDNFRFANDSYGHEIGDIMLIEAAHRIRSCAGDDDMVARMGGDEFVVLLRGVGKNEDEAILAAQMVGARIIGAFKPPVVASEWVFSTSPSIGVAIFHSETHSADDLLRQADSAMYLAKEQGKNRISFFSNEISAKMIARFEIENALREAIVNAELSLAFQPKVDYEQNLVGAEALLRWTRNGKSIAPCDFIKIAEDAGIIIPIGVWVLKETCSQVKRWEQTKNLSDSFFVSVNVSPVQLRQPNFINEVVDSVQQSGIRPRRIKLEITESSIIENIDDAIVKIQAFRNAGIEVVMDDFGTGYSSLSYLRRLPISQIKIDKSFVDNVEHDRDSEAIVRIIASLGQALRISVLAEGVETEQQFRLLEVAGCTYFQGYYFGKPMPAAEFEKLLGAPH